MVLGHHFTHAKAFYSCGHSLTHKFAYLGMAIFEMRWRDNFFHSEIIGSKLLVGGPET